MLIKKFFEEITFLGGSLFYLLFSLIFLFNKQYEIFFLFVLGLFFIIFWFLIIRAFYFKPRPEKMNYDNFLEKIDASSFPSRHSARVTFLFIFLITHFIHNFILVLAGFILASLVLCSRIYLKKHYLEDVLGGIMLGIFSFLLSIYLYTM